MLTPGREVVRTVPGPRGSGGGRELTPDRMTVTGQETILHPAWAANRAQMRVAGLGDLFVFAMSAFLPERRTGRTRSGRVRAGPGAPGSGRLSVPWDGAARGPGGGVDSQFRTYRTRAGKAQG
ncbi:hypothetical protein GCM10010400_08850 [Streptomyces aculeolatus]